MELILAVLIAGPVGYFTSTRLYWVSNALILCVGIGLNRLGSVLRERRRGPAAEAI